MFWKSADSSFVYLIGIVILLFIYTYFGVNVFLPFINKPSEFKYGANNYQTLSPPTENFIFNNPNKKVKISTSYGDIYLLMFGKSAPKNVNNFIYLSLLGYYNGTKFHRAIDGFLIQGGDRNSIDSTSRFIGRGNTGYFIEDEINWDSLDLSQTVRNELIRRGFRSTPNIETPKFDSLFIGMANSGPNTNSSQFFILLPNISNDNRLEYMNGRFTPIGKVISGENTLVNIEKNILNLDLMVNIESVQILD